MTKRLISILMAFTLLAAMVLSLSSCECKHEWETEPGVEATCEKSGYTDYQTCKKCFGFKGYEVIPQLSCVYVETVEKAPTCNPRNGEGDKRLTCSLCGYSYVKYDAIPALTEHTISGAATCTTAEKCTVCNTVINYSLGHSYEGTTDGTCTRCDYGVRFIFPTTPKTIYNTSGYDSTCIIESIKIERRQEYSSSTPSYKITFTVQSTYHENGNNYSSYAVFGWKLYDEDGIVVSSATKYTSDIKVGERTKTTLGFYVGEDEELQDGKTYTFEFLNVK